MNDSLGNDFVLLFTKDARWIFSYILMMSPSKADAEEISQETSLLEWDGSARAKEQEAGILLADGASDAAGLGNFGSENVFDAAIGQFGVGRGVQVAESAFRSLSSTFANFIHTPHWEIRREWASQYFLNTLEKPQPYKNSTMVSGKLGDCGVFGSVKLAKVELRNREINT